MIRVILVCLYSIGCAIQGSTFSEIGFKTPFTPVFLGEILLLICFLKIKLSKPVLLYISVVLVYALIGYRESGAYAFRNAALFYYPLFTVVGYQVWHHKMEPFLWALVVCMLSSMISFPMAGRAIMLGVFFALMFLTLSPVYPFRLKLIPAIFLGCLFLTADHNSLISMSNIHTIIKQYRQADQEIKVLPHVILPLSAKVYNPNSNIKTIPSIPAGGENLAEEKSRPLDILYSNIVFRIFIWRDMLIEIADHPVFGVGFGRPQRSRSLEILNWARAEWERDGWITPHCFPLHIIYRTGVLGIFFLEGMAYGFFILIRRANKNRDAYGTVFISVLLYVFVRAAFSVTLELPHYAIPFWMTAGMLLGRSRQCNYVNIK